MPGAACVGGRGWLFISKGIAATPTNAPFSGATTLRDSTARAGAKFPTTACSSGKSRKVRRMYGVLEKQFRGYFERAERMRGVTGTNLLVLLERRLDNIVYRLGFANSRAQARQLVRHNHILVDGKRVNLPSYLVKVGQSVQVTEKSRTSPLVRDALEVAARRGCPPWLELDKEAAAGRVSMLPSREDITMPIQEHLIVELYSK
jgi:small subunit ribosomal protein S4